MKKAFYNHPNDCVDESLSGFLACHRGLIQVPGRRIILRKDLNDLNGKVAMISGGGAGHEPAFAGYVGKGMLSGAIIGSMFTAPSPSDVLLAIKTVSKFSNAGVLLVVLNYTGDRMSFGLAREWALNDGIQVEMIVVAEDCAKVSSDRSAGRRGLSGGILIHKIGGALAEQGMPLQAICDILKRAAKNMGTIGICLRPCIVPGTDKPSFELKEDEMELGLGLHGEAGVGKAKIENCSATIALMLNHMTDESSAFHLSLFTEDEIVLLINNLGGTSFHEMGIVTNQTINFLREKGVIIRKVYTGTFMTSLQMQGVSITILKLAPEMPCLISLLEMEADVATPLTSAGEKVAKLEPNLKACEQQRVSPEFEKQPKLSPHWSSVLKDCIFSSCEKLIELSDELNKFDRGCGDGDCGSTFSRGAEAVMAACRMMADEDFQRPARILQTIGVICCENMGGTSGAICSIFMAACARKMATTRVFSRKLLAEGINAGIISIQFYGGGKLGDRTLLDVIEPVCNALLNSTEQNLNIICELIYKISKTSAEETIHMMARAGRASNVHAAELINPDPGAEAVSAIICSCAEVIKRRIITG